MDSVDPGAACAGGDGGIETVVHHEERPIVDDLGEREQLLDGLGIRRGLVPQLHDAHAAVDRAPDGLDHPRAPQRAGSVTR
ncbi:hypothetical protein G4G29_12955 [Microbacterium sp. Se63.02b]|nr:hypothetical protein G4G29_12955 [Microbacterium sp. Se63.02b]